MLASRSAFVLWAALLPPSAAFNGAALSPRARPRATPYASDDTQRREELLARLAAKEQAQEQSIAAERAAPVPTTAKKSPIEKLRIVFGGKQTVAKTASSDLCVLPDAHQQPYPDVDAPPGFTPSKPRPFIATGDFVTLLSAVAALFLRLVSGVFVIRWRPRLWLRPPPPGQHALKLGPLPLYLSDSSAVLRGEVARPAGRLILYEFDSSPFCRKVRDAITHLDLEVEMRPCPGAGHAPPNYFGDEHLRLHGRRTVPFLIDEGEGVGLFESEEIVSHLYDKYGTGAATAPFALRGVFALVSSGIAAIIRGMPADKLQIDARADTHRMRPLTLYGYEGSPFVHPVRERLSCAPHAPWPMTLMSAVMTDDCGGSPLIAGAREALRARAAAYYRAMRPWLRPPRSPRREDWSPVPGAPPGRPEHGYRAEREHRHPNVPGLHLHGERLHAAAWGAVPARRAGLTQREKLSAKEWRLRRMSAERRFFVSIHAFG